MTQIILSVQYDWRLVALSIAIAVYASYAAFGFAGRIADARGRKQTLWIGAGATAMGLGIWSMQCIGMMALILPVPVRYNVPIIVVSLFAAIISSAVALFVVSRKQISDSYLIGGGFALGVGIAALHYSGMAAMQFAAYAVYNPGFVALSIIIAVVASGAALQLARLQDPGARPFWMRVACASVMGLAIGATHYTGMAAVSFRYAQELAAGSHSVSGPGLSITGIALLTVAVLAVSLPGSRVDRKFSIQRQMLLSEQERWLLVVSASLDGLFDFDLITGQVFYSPRWKAILGYGPNELEPTLETWRRCLYPDDRQAAEDTLEKYIRSGQGVLETEYRASHRDGSIRWISLRAQAVWDHNKKPIRLVGCHSDITERKRSEEKLLSSEARYRGLFEANPLPSWIYSPQDLRIQDANQAALDYFGWAREEFVGKPINSIRMPGEDPSALPSDGAPHHAPWRLRRKNKSGIWVELSNYEIEGAASPARLMIANDVTAHVVNEARIERAKGQLEGLVAQKSAKLQTIEAKWQTLTETLPPLVWSTRPDGDCDFISSQWAEQSGVPAEQLLGSGWLDTIHPADRAHLEACRLQAVKTGERYKVEYRVRKKDGSYRWLSAEIIPMRSAPSEPITHWLGTSTDIENEKQSVEV
jgi:PAS domain S-box-containing protein